MLTQKEIERIQTVIDEFTTNELVRLHSDLCRFITQGEEIAQFHIMIYTEIMERTKE